MASTLNTTWMNPNLSRPTPGAMGWGWASQGCYPKVITRSSQGHRKVKQLKIGENSLFLLGLLQFNSLEMLMVVKTHLDPSMEIYQNTPRGHMVNIRARGVIPHQITLMSPLPHMAEMDQITRRLSC